MIDWLTFTAPLVHSQPINAGRVLSIDSDGVMEWESDKRRRVTGSHDSSIQIRSLPGCTGISVDGNPTKWFQGHNLWGTDDLQGLVHATLHELALRFQLDLSAVPEAVQGATLTRVDINDSFHLKDSAHVRSWIRSADQTAVLRNRGRGSLNKGGTLYFGKHSRRWSLKFYGKGQEIRAKGHEQELILSHPAALAWADCTLRAELTLRGMHLKEIGLSCVSDWTAERLPSGPFQMLKTSLEGMSMTTTRSLEPELMQTLTPSIRSALLAWESGADLRGYLPPATFYRYRRQLLPHGIDIATLFPKDVSTVVPLYGVLETKPAVVPAWAHSDGLFFDPQAYLEHSRQAA